jgi:hypothetical protein
MSDFGGWGYASQIQVLFESSEFSPLVLRQKMTALDFISQCGGSLGLFLGFSALSAVEVVYFFTVRIFFKRMGRNRVTMIVTNKEATEDKKSSYFEEVMRSSTIHGCNHAVSKEFHRLEKFELFVVDVDYSLLILHCLFSLCSCLWLLIVIVAFSYCCSTTFRIYENNRNAPTVVTFEDVMETSVNVSWPKTITQQLIRLLSVSISCHHLQQ